MEKKKSELRYLKSREAEEIAEKPKKKSDAEMGRSREEEEIAEMERSDIAEIHRQKSREEETDFSPKLKNLIFVSIGLTQMPNGLAQITHG